jgi:acetyl esterase/lipase
MPFKRWGLWGSALVAAGAVLAAIAAASPVRALNALSSLDPAEVSPTMRFGPGPRQQLDVYRPRGPAPAAGWPVVVFFYGGSWNRGERADYRFVGTALASRGMLALVADYRLYPEVRYPDFLTDCALALAFGLEQAGALGGDPRRVFVMGHSAGAYNAAMLAFDARWLRATGHAPQELAGFIGLAGPYDFLPMTNREAQPVFFHPDYPPDTQPLALVGPGAPPSFLGAALNDDLIDPQRNTVGLAKRLQSLASPTTLRLYGGVNHMTLVGALAWPLRWLAPVLDDVAAFVDGSARQRNGS